MVLDVREFTRGGYDAVIVGNVYFQKCRLAEFLCDLLRRLATSLCIPCTYKHLKSFGRELSRDFVANAFVRAGNQSRFHDRLVRSSSITRATFSLVSGSSSGA